MRRWLGLAWLAIVLALASPCWAAVTLTATPLGALLSGAATTVSASWTPVANRYYLLAIHGTGVGGSNLPSVTGNGLTWVQVQTIPLTSTNERLTVFRALTASPTAGTLTIDFAGQSNDGLYYLAEFSGTDLTGTNGSGATTTSGTGTGFSGAQTVTLGAAGDALFGALAQSSANTADFTAGTGFTLLTQWSSGGAATGIEWTATSGTVVNATSVDTTSWAIIGVAIKAAAVGGGTPTRHRSQSY